MRPKPVVFCNCKDNTGKAINYQQNRKNKQRQIPDHPNKGPFPEVSEQFVVNECQPEYDDNQHAKLP